MTGAQRVGHAEVEQGAPALGALGRNRASPTHCLGVLGVDGGGNDVVVAEQDEAALRSFSRSSTKPWSRSIQLSL